MRKKIMTGMALLVMLAMLTISCNNEKNNQEDNDASTENPTETFDTSEDTEEEVTTVIDEEVTTVKDIDGNVYKTVELGNQVWMAENLRTTRYANGESIPLGTSTSTITSYRYNPNDNANNVPTYGYLYNWPAVMQDASSSSANPSGVQGICPDGWHVPSDAEWTELTDYVGSQNEYFCGGDREKIAKALASTEGWNTYSESCVVGNNRSANNATGFSALPAGVYYDGNYGLFGDYAAFWTATKNYDNGAYYRGLHYGNAYVYMGDDYNKGYGFSVRCVRD